MAVSTTSYAVTVVIGIVVVLVVGQLLRRLGHDFRREVHDRYYRARHPDTAERAAHSVRARRCSSQVCRRELDRRHGAPRSLEGAGQNR